MKKYIILAIALCCLPIAKAVSEWPIDGGKGTLDPSVVVPGAVPIGGVLAVMPTTHANAWKPPTSCTTDDDGVSDGIKDGFVLAGWSSGNCSVPASCSDCVIPATTVLPDMYNRVPRGANSSGGLTGADFDTIDLVPANIPQIYNSTLSVTGATDIDHNHGSTGAENSDSIVHQSSVSVFARVTGTGTADLTRSTNHDHTHTIANYNVAARALVGGVTSTLTVGTAANDTFQVDTIPRATDVIWVIRVK